MVGYYDYILGFIPFALFGLTFALNAVGFALTTAVPVGAGVAVLAMGHALFVNGPVDDVVDAEASTASPLNAD